MKKIVFMALVMVLMSSWAIAFDGSKASRTISSDGVVVVGGNNYITGLIILSDGTNDATITLYDNASTNSGDVIATLYVPGALKANRMTWPYPRKITKGIYADLTGTGASVVVEYITK